jgi:hypothetical protein
VVDIANQYVEIGADVHRRQIDAYYIVQAERKDVPRLEVEQ